jgi:hypothetical protein
MRNKIRTVTIKDISLGSKLTKVRTELLKHSKAGASFPNKITVFALQQGIGKTHMFTEYANKHWKKEKIILASPRHNHLEEVAKKLGDDKSRHWYGFSAKDEFGTYKGCEKLNHFFKPLPALKMHEALLNPKYVCSIINCNKGKCDFYNNRRKSNKIDLVPLEYLGKDILVKQKPDIIFIDESIDKIDTFTFDIEAIDDCIAIADMYQYNTLFAYLNKLKWKPTQGPTLQSLIKAIEKYIDDLIKDCISIEDYIGATIANGMQSTLQYFRLAQSYQSTQVNRPMIYDVFNLVFNHGIKVVFLNASFNKELFRYYLETYPHSHGNISVPIYYSNITNPNSTLIRMYPDNKYWKGAFTYKSKKRTLEEIFKVLQVVENYIPREKIGIITYKRAGKYPIVNVDKEFQSKNYDTIHFWDEAGLNILEKKYVLVVVGTPFIPTEEIIELWERTFDEKSNLKPKDISGTDKNGYYITDELVTFKSNIQEQILLQITSQTICDVVDGWNIPIYHYHNAPAWIHHKLSRDYNLLNTKNYDFSIVKKQYIDQLVDSLHRNRPLTHNRVIFAFGDVLCHYPWIARLQRKNVYSKNKQSINPLLGLKQIETDDLNVVDKTLKKHKIVIDNEIQQFFEFILDNKDYNSNTALAKTLGVWNNMNNPDIHFIKNIKNIADKIKKKIL